MKQFLLKMKPAKNSIKNPERGGLLVGLITISIALTSLYFSVSDGYCQGAEKSPPISVFDPPNSGIMPFTGGYVKQLTIPDGIDDLRWEADKFVISFTVDWNNSGQVTNVSRIENDVALRQAWKTPFEKACVAALKKWIFKPTLNRRGEAVASGTSIRIEFQRNKAGDSNMEINDGGGVVLTTNTRFEK